MLRKAGKLKIQSWKATEVSLPRLESYTTLLGPQQEELGPLHSRSGYSLWASPLFFSPQIGLFCPHLELGNVMGTTYNC
jgi:hypothetical protein